MRAPKKIREVSVSSFHEPSHHRLAGPGNQFSPKNPEAKILRRYEGRRPGEAAFLAQMSDLERGLQGHGITLSRLKLGVKQLLAASEGARSLEPMCGRRHGIRINWQLHPLPSQQPTRRPGAATIKRPSKPWMIKGTKLWPNAQPGVLRLPARRLLRHLCGETAGEVPFP